MMMNVSHDRHLVRSCWGRGIWVEGLTLCRRGGGLRGLEYELFLAVAWRWRRKRRTVEEEKTKNTKSFGEERIGS